MMRLRFSGWFFAFTVFLAACAQRAPAPSTPAMSAGAAEASAVIRYTAVHHPVIGRYGMVVSQNDVASRVGAAILKRGGNAVDTAIAVGFALAVTLPRAGNIGGSGFMLIKMADGNETLALDFRSAAPAAASVDAYLDAAGELDRDQMTFGSRAPAVPGTVAGFAYAWEQHGTLPWSALVEPALDLAEDGIVVTEDLAFALKEAHPILTRYEGSAAAYLKPDGSAYAVGDRLVQPDLAWSLRHLAEGGAEAFYRGPIGQRIADHMASSGGLITRQDFADYRVRVREPVVGRYRDHKVVAVPPVSSGGLTLVQMLNVLSHFELEPLKAGSAKTLHLLAEVMKRSAANRRVGLGDPDYVDLPRQGYLSTELAADLAAGIDLDSATPVAKIDPADARHYESRDTTHYSVVDQHGNAVSTTYTLGYSFGSGFAVPGTGILLDNQMRNFTYGKPGHANELKPGKRMASTMTPTIVLDPEGDVLLVTGSPGGSRIINIVLQLIVNVVDFDMNVAEATHAPRIHQQWRTPDLGVEPGTSPDTVRLLESLGHSVVEQQTMGSTQSIERRENLLYGAADPRRPGAAAIGLNQAPGKP